MAKIDAWLISRTESLCHCIQRLTGRSCIWLGYQIFLLACCLALWFFFSLFAGLEDMVPRVVTMMAAAVLLSGVGLIVVYRIESLETIAYRRLSKGLENPAKIDPVMCAIRLILLAYCLCFGPDLRLTGMGWVYLLGLYAISCDPLPPCRSRLMEWFEGFRVSSFDHAKAPAQK